MYKSVKSRDNRKVEYLMLKQKDLKRVTLIEACIKGECTVNKSQMLWEFLNAV